MKPYRCPVCGAYRAHWTRPDRALLPFSRFDLAGAAILFSVAAIAASTLILVIGTVYWLLR